MSVDPGALQADLHCHSTFSDGRDPVADNVAEAERLELTALGCVDHVRADTTYVPDFVAEVRRVAATTGVTITAGIEAKLLDTSGRLDLPPARLRPGVDTILAADHQVPLADGPHHPREVRAELEAGTRTAQEVLEAIVTSTANAVRTHDDVLVAHLFSVLPKLGLDEEEVGDDLLDHLAAACADSGAIVEVSERWRCPSVRSLRPFLARDVRIVASTDAHRNDHIGRYDYVSAVLAELSGQPAWTS